MVPAHKDSALARSSLPIDAQRSDQNGHRKRDLKA